jgi:CheY-like chemotaxis protein
MSIETAASPRVLIVEDEMLVAMLLEDMLSDEGYEVAGAASNIPQALKLATDENTEFDVAILDVNVAGQPVFAVADALEQRGKPFAFATGYGEGGLPDAWRGRPTLQKPFSQADVARVLKTALNG